jgi:glycosyltransferase involved in cell wall biosynthesis
MKVLIVSRASYPLPASQGGTDAYALRTATFLVPQGHEVYLVGQGRPGPAFGGVHFIRVPTDVPVTSRHRVSYFAKGFLLSLASTATAMRFLLRPDSRVDVIHCNSNVAVVILKRLFPNTPMVYTLHDPLFSSKRPGSLLERLVRPFNNGLFERRALRRADHIIAVSPEIRAQAEQLLGSAEKLTLLYPFPRANGPRPDRPASPDELNPPVPYVLSVGAQTGRKRFDLLIGAIARTTAPVNLVLVGTGSDRPRLVRIAAELGVAGRVVFYDQVTDAQIETLYRGALAYAMASAREGFPTTLMEAVLCGTPSLYFTEAETEELERFQSDFFRVVHTLDEAEIARTLEVACSRGLEGALDRRRIARWAKSQFPSPESMAGEINRIYNDVTDQLRGSISALAEDGPGGGSAGSARAWTTPSSGGGVAPTNSKRP